MARGPTPYPKSALTPQATAYFVFYVLPVVDNATEKPLHSPSSSEGGKTKPASQWTPSLESVRLVLSKIQCKIGIGGDEIPLVSREFKCGKDWCTTTFGFRDGGLGNEDFKKYRSSTYGGCDLRQDSAIVTFGGYTDASDTGRFMGVNKKLNSYTGLCPSDSAQASIPPGAGRKFEINYAEFPESILGKGQFSSTYFKKDYGIPVTVVSMKIECTRPESELTPASRDKDAKLDPDIAQLNVLQFYASRWPSHIETPFKIPEGFRITVKDSEKFKELTERRAVFAVNGKATSMLDMQENDVGCNFNFGSERPQLPKVGDVFLLFNGAKGPFLDYLHFRQTGKWTDGNQFLGENIYRSDASYVSFRCVAGRNGSFVNFVRFGDIEKALEGIATFENLDKALE